MILAGDIGGTKANFALFAAEGPITVENAIHQGTLPSGESADVQALVRGYLDQADVTVGDLELACLGIAGPVVDQHVEAPNLPWVVDGRALDEDLGIGGVLLINDLEATGFGVPLLAPEQLATLNVGLADQRANGALIAAGTGLGQALLMPGADGMVTRPSEGGHCSFAPRGELQIGLLQHLMKRWPHVSVERVVSGPGIFEIYDYLATRGDHGTPSAELAEQLAAPDADRSAVVGLSALSGESELCVAALELFVDAYGAEAGNLALKALAFAGLFIGGGVAPKVRPFLDKGDRFIKAFTDKGRFSDLLERVPVQLILEPKAAVYGAARRGQMQYSASENSQ